MSELELKLNREFDDLRMNAQFDEMLEFVDTNKDDLIILGWDICKIQYDLKLITKLINEL